MSEDSENGKNSAPGEFSIRDQMAGRQLWDEAPPSSARGDRPPPFQRPVRPRPEGEPVLKTGGDNPLGSIDFMKILKGIGQRRRMIFGVALAVFALGLLGGIKAAHVKYGARVSLLYRTERQQQVLASAGSTLMMKGMSRQTAVGLIERRSNFEQVISNLNLSVDVDELRWRVQVKAEKTSQIVFLETTGFPDRDLAVKVANELATVAIEDNVRFYRGQAAMSAVQFQRQEEIAAKELAQLTRAVSDFQTANRLIEPSADAKSFFDSIAATSERLSSARIEYQSLLVRIQNYRQLIAGLSNEVVRQSFEDSPIKRRISNTEVALMEARTRFGPENPKVKQLEDEIKELRRMAAEKTFDQNREQVFEPNPVKAQFETELLKLEAERSVLQQSVSQLEAELKTIEQRFDHLPRQQLELSGLQQRKQSADELVKAMKKSRDNAEMASQMDLADFEVLELARDAEARRSVLAVVLPVVGFILGLIGGLVVAVLLEFLDPFLKTRKQVEGAYTVPLAQIIPSQDGLDEEAARQLFLPVCRRLYDRWQRWSAETPCRTLGFAASGVGEGKSSIAYHLARYCSSLGVKTLLIDFDARDNRWMAAFPFTRGVEEYLRGKAEWADVVGTADGMSGMKVLSPAPDLLELMNSPAMARLWETARGAYDLVIVDGPGISEDDAAPFLAGLVDRLIFVIGSPMAAKSVVDSALARLEEHHVRPALLVMNMAPRELNPKENPVPADS